MSFCGHATIASGVRPDGEGEYIFETLPGEVTVAVRTINGRTESALTSVAPRHKQASRNLLLRVLETLAWQEAEIDQFIPPALAFAGAWHFVIAAKTAERLHRVNYDNAPVDIVILQGEAMGRPSGLQVHIPEQGGIVVSGHAVDLGR